MMDYLEQTKWTHPESYFGHSPVGDYVLYTKTRDSSPMERTNFDYIMGQFETIIAQLGDDSFDKAGDPYLSTFSASHCMCGWIEYIMLSKDAPFVMLNEANELLHSLSDYPSLDDDALSEMEWNAAQDTWRECYSVRERAQMIKDSNQDISIFAARRDWIPEGDCGFIYESMEPWV